jgi:hypothetical protein
MNLLNGNIETALVVIFGASVLFGCGDKTSGTETHPQFEPGSIARGETAIPATPIGDGGSSDHPDSHASDDSATASGVGPVGDSSLAEADLIVNMSSAGTRALWVTYLGDINGNGADDLAVNMRMEQGRGLYLLYGGPRWERTDLSEDASAVFRESNAWTGLRAPIRAGDVNGSGYDDFLIGQPRQLYRDPELVHGGNDRKSSGSVWLFYGGADKYEGDISMDDSSALGAEIRGEPGQSRTGHSLTVADLDGDGYPDMLIGLHEAPFSPGSTAPLEYTWHVFYGGPQTMPDVTSLEDADAVLTLHADDPLIQAADAVGVGDFDGDGYEDVIFTAESHDSDDRSLYLLYGHEGRFEARGAIEEYATVIHLAPHPIASIGAGDLNGDGLNDLVIATKPSREPGVVHVILGRAERLLAPHDIDDADILIAAAGNSSFPGRVAAGGDINGDGYEDVLASASTSHSGRSRTWLFYGGPQQFLDPRSPADSDASFVGGYDDSSRGAGFRLAADGDFDGDGYDDIAIISMGVEGEAGNLYIIYGGP